MKQLATLSLVLMGLVFMALAGCDSDPGTSNNGGDVVDSGYDVVGNDKADDPCGPYGCMNQDALPEEDVGGEEDSDAPEVCEADFQCPDGWRCDTLQSLCIDPENDPLTPFLWMETQWEVVEGNLPKGELVYVGIMEWDPEKEVALSKGLSPFNNWHFWYEGDTLRGEGLDEDGDYEVQNFVYEEETKKLSFDSYRLEDGHISHWCYQLE